jgi:hypothetical protein
MRERKLAEGESHETIEVLSKASQTDLQRNDLNGLNGWNELNDYYYSACNQQRMDLCSNPPILGFDGVFEHGYRFPRSVE